MLAPQHGKTGTGRISPMGVRHHQFGCPRHCRTRTFASTLVVLLNLMVPCWRCWQWIVTNLHKVMARCWHRNMGRQGQAGSHRWISDIIGLDTEGIVGHVEPAVVLGLCHVQGLAVSVLPCLFLPPLNPAHNHHHVPQACLLCLDYDMSKGWLCLISPACSCHL